MSSRSKIEKWLLADWSTGNSNIPLLAGDVKVMSLQPNDGVEEEIVYERPLLEQRLRLTRANESISKEENVPREGRDYSPSCSSWAPSDGGSSSDESDQGRGTKTAKMEQYMRHCVKRRNGKDPVPVHRPNAVVNVLKERQNNLNNRSNGRSRKRKYKETKSGNKSLPDSTKKHLPAPKSSVDTTSIHKKKIMDMKASFKELFKIIDYMKPDTQRRTTKYFDNTTVVQAGPLNEVSNIIIENPVYNNTEAYEESVKSHSEESNRSDDNVLISNKYSKVRELTEDQTIPNKQENLSQNEVEEWVPIGSGKTLIHKDKFRKVNWRSYTIATRALLLATFPRRILATHSLTGKRSPAFQDKPAKMCLDPKIVSDIIIEITSKFNVKENLVRSAITTKCADECKMLKTRMLNKSKLIESQNDAPPPRKAKQEPRQVKTEKAFVSQV
ncbi:jg14322 [Pararge aegeria aegeria]|uniref:Jg14322 protein n=1 Tax=Pararge aegeria aegeria TaxID=348720 RepID=A0A8S4R8J7_9NEOP|nr:jg14322 [Pararge aegeria aegeria]